MALALFGLVVVGLLVALVVLGALMLNRMGRIHHSSLDLAETVRQSQRDTQGAMQSLGTQLAVIPETASKAQDAAKESIASVAAMLTAPRPPPPPPTNTLNP